MLYSHQLQNLNPAPAILTTNHMKATVDMKYRNVVSPTWRHPQHALFHAICAVSIKFVSAFIQESHSLKKNG
jgi:hypothetical protein